MHPINLSEYAAMGAGFSKTAITKVTDGDTVTTTIYAGHAPVPSPSSETLQNPGWVIRKTVVVENAETGVTDVTELWGHGSWTGRAEIDYSFN